MRLLLKKRPDTTHAAGLRCVCPGPAHRGPRRRAWVEAVFGALACGVGKRNGPAPPGRSPIYGSVEAAFRSAGVNVRNCAGRVRGHLGQIGPERIAQIASELNGVGQLRHARKVHLVTSVPQARDRGRCVRRRSDDRERRAGTRGASQIPGGRSRFPPQSKYPTSRCPRGSRSLPR